MIKNLLLIFICLGLVTSVSAQSYSDDFEGYNVGDYIGNESNSFTTWSGTTGGAEDAQITDEKAKSGSHSIYFYSTTQGPQDVVLDFGDKYTTGTFNLKFSIWMADGSEAYWNIQQEATIGQVWASNTWMRDNGVATFDGDGGGKTVETAFNKGEWNDIEYDIDLDNNEWIIKVNGVCVGTLLAPAAVASLDLFPLTSTDLSEFWIDDVSFDYSETPVDKNKDVAISETQISGVAFANEPAAVQTLLTNTGSEMVENVTLEATVGGSTKALELTDLGLAAGEETLVVFEDLFNPDQGLNIIEVAVTNIDGVSADDKPCNDVAVFPAQGVVPTPNKRVVVEEGTGTWCPWCPRGAVFLDRMEEKYDERFIGIAVHNGANDPMVVSEYDSYMSFSGYPNVRVERTGGDIDPSGIETPLISALQDPINETFKITATWDEDLNEIVANVTVYALNNISSTREIMLVITEDGVTGTGSQWAQANAYAGGGNGAMGGYEDLANPVPASQMVYDHVARAILPAPGGMDLGDPIAAGESATFTFGTTLGSDVNLDNVHLVAMMTAPFPAGKIDNAYDITLSEALLLNNQELPEVADVKVYPNPADNVTYLRTEFEQSSEVSMEVYSITGQMIKSQNFGKLQGDQVFTINTENFSNGIYNVVLTIDGQRVNQKVVVSH